MFQAPKPSHKPHPRTQFSPEEDAKIEKLVQRYGENDWNQIAAKMKGRNVRQCRERWRNYLSPDLDKSTWKEEEDKLLMDKFKELGPKWKTISALFPNRTDISVKNRMHKIARSMEKKQGKKNKNGHEKTKTEAKPEDDFNFPDTADIPDFGVQCHEFLTTDLETNFEFGAPFDVFCNF